MRLGLIIRGKFAGSGVEKYGPPFASPVQEVKIEKGEINGMAVKQTVFPA
jgi:hypothetical protein